MTNTLNPTTLTNIRIAPAADASGEFLILGTNEDGRPVIISSFSQRTSRLMWVAWVLLVANLGGLAYGVQHGTGDAALAGVVLGLNAAWIVALLRR